MAVVQLVHARGENFGENENWLWLDTAFIYTIHYTSYSI